MEANQGSDALRRYPLHTTPYLRRSSSAFNQPLSSSSFVSPQSYSQWPTRTCSCPCSCMLSASSPQSNLHMSTLIKEATISSTCKRGLDQDSNKENLYEIELATMKPERLAHRLRGLTHPHCCCQGNENHSRKLSVDKTDLPKCFPPAPTPRIQQMRLVYHNCTQSGCKFSTIFC